MSDKITRRSALAAGLALPLAGVPDLSGREPPTVVPPTSISEPPQSLPPLPVAIYDTDGNLLRVTHSDDPREAFCRHFNGLNAGRARAVAIPMMQVDGKLHGRYGNRPDAEEVVKCLGGDCARVTGPHPR